MPKKTLALIAGLVVVTIVLFIIALRAGQQQQAPSIPPNSQTQKPTPVIPAHTVLMLDPNPLAVLPGQFGKIDVNIDTSDNKVTAVQLELGYDPTIISNVKIITGPMFTNPAVLINKNNPTTGRYTYAFGISPSGPPVKGMGVVATITFTTLPGTLGKDTQIGLLPTSLVTARGVAQSVLKKATGTVVTIGNTAAKTTTTVTTGTTANITVPERKGQ